MVEQYIQIRINRETHIKLNALGQRFETFDNIINRLIEHYKTKVT